MRSTAVAIAPWLGAFAGLVLGCSGTSDSAGPPEGSDSLVDAGDGGLDGPSVDSSLDVLPLDTSASCIPGSPCEDGGVCVGQGVCCAEELGCGALCCGAGQVCSFERCLTPGAECRDSTSCGTDFYCDYTLGASPEPQEPDDAALEAGAGTCHGGSPPTGRCLPKPPLCPEGQESDAGTEGPISCLEPCQVRPGNDFAPEVLWSWPQDFASVAAPEHREVMAAPVVINLNDDNCDGKVDERDIPDVVFNTYAQAAYTANGILRAVSGDTGASLWDAIGTPTDPGASIAAGDIDGDGLAEVITCATPGATSDGQVLVFDNAGALKWSTNDPHIHCGMTGLSLGDVDSDGVPEILVRYTVIDTTTHAIKWMGREVSGLYRACDYTSFADLDEDGDLDIVGGNITYRNDGTGQFEVLWQSELEDGYPAVADLDQDGSPEVITMASLDGSAASHFIRAHKADGSLLWGPININQPGHGDASETGGGPPTVADFDGDGKPEIATAGGSTYIVLEGESGEVKWAKDTVDHSSRVTGSSVFDFQGDGKAEVVYQDEHNMHVYDGTSGDEILTICNPSGTLWEYPVIADVNNDNQAEIVVVSNDMWWSCDATGQPYQGPSGVRVFHDTKGNWVRTRGIWNQHPYHVTNIDENGVVPAHEARNWEQRGLNNFRQNVQPGGEFSAPDAVISLRLLCTTPVKLEATVRNVGEAPLPQGLPVRFYSIDADSSDAALTLIGSALTTRKLYPLDSEEITLSIDTPAPEILNGTQWFKAIVDDPAPQHSWKECRADNNESPPAHLQCSMPR